MPVRSRAEQADIVDAGVGAGGPPRVRPAEIDHRRAAAHQVRRPVRTEGPAATGQAGGGRDRPGRHPARRPAATGPPVPPDAADQGRRRMPGSSGSPATAGRNCRPLLGPAGEAADQHDQTADGKPVEEPDPRSHGQRMHDALSEVCDRLLRTDNAVPDSGGTPATVIVTIDLDDLLNNTGYARRLRRHPDPHRHRTRRSRPGRHLLGLHPTHRPDRSIWAAPADRLPAKPSPSSPATKDARSRLRHPPGMGERHHIRPWIDGGTTDLDNLTLLCRLPPPQLPHQRLGLPHRRRRTARMATTPVDRPPPHPHDQQPEPRRTRRHRTPTTLNRTGSSWRPYRGAP